MKELLIEKARKLGLFNFWENVDVRGPNDCWPTNNTNARGYSITHYKAKSWSTHSLVYFQKHGTWDKKYQIFHWCDGKACCNDSHLFLGTPENLKEKSIRDLYKKTNPNPLSGCLNFNGYNNKSGYPIIYYDGKKRNMHHLVWELYNGPIPKGMWLDQICDDKTCIEIKHLRLATPEYLRFKMEEKFFNNIEKMPNDGCWMWRGSLNSNGYGRLWLNCKSVPVHRLSYELHCGPVPKDKMICHSCDTPACVKPDHLRIGTATDNVQDCIERGRKVYTTKLNPEQIIEIRTGLAKGLSQSTIAKEYGVSQCTISRIYLDQTMNYINIK